LGIGDWGLAQNPIPQTQNPKPPHPKPLFIKILKI